MSDTMNKKVKIIQITFVFLLFSGLVFCDSLKVGESVPEIDTKTIDGKAFKFSELKGKILIVDFWATWCVPCVNEFPKFEEFYKKNKDKGVELVAISIEKDLNKVLNFQKKHQYSFTILHDEKLEIVKKFKINEPIPILFIFGSDGLLKYEPLVGGKHNIDQLLEEKLKELNVKTK
jgi:peroxiredoxin